MKINPMDTVSCGFGHRWAVAILVAATWTAIVTLYVLGGLRHGYIGDEIEALSTLLSWMIGGGILLAWVLWKCLFNDSSWQRPSMGQLPASTQAGGDEVINASQQGHADGRDECGLRMGVSGFGYYCGAVRTDDD
ncbi:MAG TPA: hypothetical protein PLQ71_10525 [Nitrospira sp.]|nr:hypothetical protein [Nitrospira sp.]